MFFLIITHNIFSHLIVTSSFFRTSLKDKKLKLNTVCWSGWEKYSSLTEVKILSYDTGYYHQYLQAELDSLFVGSTHLREFVFKRLHSPDPDVLHWQFILYIV